MGFVDIFYYPVSKFVKKLIIEICALTNVFEQTES
jgi:hypothetical protein